MGEEVLFTCAACQRPVSRNLWNRGKEQIVAPICRYCESVHRGRSPSGGAFMDRRKALHIFILAEALSFEAHYKRWSTNHGRP